MGSSGVGSSGVKWGGEGCKVAASPLRERDAGEIIRRAGHAREEAGRGEMAARWRRDAGGDDETRPARLQAARGEERAEHGEMR